MGCPPKLSHKVDLAVIGYGAACLLCARFCFASFLFSPLSKLFPNSEQSQRNRPQHGSHLTFNFSLVLTFSKVLPALSVPIKRLSNTSFYPPLKCSVCHGSFLTEITWPSSETHSIQAIMKHHSKTVAHETLNFIESVRYSQNLPHFTTIHGCSSSLGVFE